MRVQLCSTSTIEGNKCDSFVIESAVIPQLNSGVMMVILVCAFTRFDDHVSGF